MRRLWFSLLCLVYQGVIKIHCPSEINYLGSGLGAEQMKGSSGIRHGQWQKVIRFSTFISKSSVSSCPNLSGFTPLKRMKNAEFSLEFSEADPSHYTRTLKE